MKKLSLTTLLKAAERYTINEKVVGLNHTKI